MVRHDSRILLTVMRVLRSWHFWIWGLTTAIVAIVFFLWELRLVQFPIPALPRVPATTFDIVYSLLLALLFGIAAGLFGWQQRFGACPRGTKRTAGIAGVLSAVALLCPVCLILPASFLGLSVFFAVLPAYLPLIRLVSIIFVLLTVWLLWPRTNP